MGIYLPRRKLPQLSTLQAFINVAETKSFSKAATALSLTNSAISHQIRQLEEHLGITLLERLSTGVSLTNSGLIYLSEVKESLDRIERAGQLIKSDLKTRPLRISVLPSFAGSLLVPELLSFLELNPDIHIEIDANAGTENDPNNQVDLFIRYGKSVWSNYEHIKLMDVNLFPVCSPSYLEKNGPINQLSDLTRVVLLRHTMEPWQPWLDLAVSELDQITSINIIPTGPLYTDARVMLIAARDGQGVALARDVLVDLDIRENNLVKLLDFTVQSTSSYYAYFKPSVMNRPEFKIFLSWLVGACNQLKPHQN